MAKKLALMLVASVVLLVLAAPAGAAPTTLQADLNAPGNPVAIGWVESTFPESATVHLAGALPNTDFILTGQYWTGTATAAHQAQEGCRTPVNCGRTAAVTAWGSSSTSPCRKE